MVRNLKLSHLIRSKASKNTVAFQHCTGMLANAMKQEKEIQKDLENFKLQ